MSKFFVTTPIYYVNARPHIGHAYTTIVADVLARRARAQGTDTFFLTGTDEHGQKIERSAQAAGIPPQAFTDHVSQQFRTLWDRMGLTYDKYIRTTDPAHKAGAQKLFTTLYERGFIYLASYTGSYCVSDEAFVDLPAGTPCPDCGRALETVTEENFFFKLSEFQEKLIDLIESNELVITPDTARNEVLSFIRGGLRDLSISRSSFTWGIPVPEPAASAAGQKHVIYVWLDALANYMTALGYGAEDDSLWQKFWPADLHLVGKEITRFHCVYWPAFLMAAGIATPKSIAANGWLLFDNAKMSKSRGNVVKTETILDALGPLCPPAPSLPLSFRSEAEESAVASLPEAPSKAEQDLFASDILRYYLLREIPFGQDGSFTFEALFTRYNADLANGYGNLVSRTLKMIQQYFRGTIIAEVSDDWTERDWMDWAFGKSPGIVQWSSPDEPAPDKMIPEYNMHKVLEHATRTVKLMAGKYGQVGFQAQLAEIALTIRMTDGFISTEAPWKLAKQPERTEWLTEVLYTAAESIRIITLLLHPILPYATTKVWTQLGLDPSDLTNHQPTTLQWGGLKPGTKLGPLGPIFPRADKGLAQIMSDMESAPLAAITEQNDATHRATDDLPTTPIASEAPSQDPAAGPRTSTLPEINPGSHVAGSQATTTERPGTPSHTEAQASGIFASQQPADASPQISIDDFAKVELRVAQILICERIPKADKLLRLEVDLGYEKRQILSGIAEWYTPEELVGRRIVVITNLAPRKMRGLESHGMLLAASTEGGKPHLATFADAESLPLGSRLK